MAYQLTAGKFSATTDAGAPASGFKLYTYESGTTTPLATYTSSTLASPNTNPVILNARGEANVWMGTSAYTFVLKTAADVTVWTVDGVLAPDAAALADLALTTAGKGGDLIGFDWAVVPSAANTERWGIQTAAGAVNVLRYIPRQYWADIQTNAGTVDVSSYIQTALSANKCVFFPLGTYGIGAPINFPTQRHILGAGIGTIWKALPALAGAAKPTITPNIYTPVLDKVPMLYNATSIQWWSVKGIYFNGDSQDVYGIWLHENFYGNFTDVYILSTLSRPYTNIRGQGITHLNFVCYGCGDSTHDGGAVSYDNTNFNFIGDSGFERLRCTWAYDQRQPNAFSKGGVTLDGTWFESDSTGFPSQGFLRLSGRRNKVDAHFAFHTTATTERMVELNDTTDSRVIDGITMGANACQGARVTVNNATGSMLLNAKTGTLSNKVRGWFSNTLVTDSGSGNSWDINASLATQVPHVTGRFQVRDGGTTPSATAANYVIDCDYNAGTRTIRLLGNAGNTITNPSGQLTWTSALASNFVVTSGNMNFTAATFTFNTTTGAVLLPSMTTTQKNAIGTPINGMILFDSTLGKVQVREAGAWSNVV